MFFCLLSKFQVFNVLSEWTDFVEIANLDSAVCNVESRIKFLKFYSVARFATAIIENLTSNAYFTVWVYNRKLCFKYLELGVVGVTSCQFYNAHHLVKLTVTDGLAANSGPNSSSKSTNACN